MVACGQQIRRRRHGGRIRARKRTQRTTASFVRVCSRRFNERAARLRTRVQRALEFVRLVGRALTLRDDMQRRSKVQRRSYNPLRALTLIGAGTTTRTTLTMRSPTTKRPRRTKSRHATRPSDPQSMRQAVQPNVRRTMQSTARDAHCAAMHAACSTHHGRRIGARLAGGLGLSTGFAWAKPVLQYSRVASAGGAAAPKAAEGEAERRRLRRGRSRR